ncbi:MAG: M28 family metallopeptidase [Terracidiphilus sp.]
MRNRSLFVAFLLAALAVACAQTADHLRATDSHAHAKLATGEAAIEQAFLVVPSAQLAGEELKTLTAQPHVAGTPEDHATALYVARKFREAGLETEIVPYRVLLNWPKEVRVQAYDAQGKLLMTGPTREHVSHDPYQENPKIIMPFNGSSGSGDVTAPVVYANYGRLEDFKKLDAEHIDLHGKIVIVRYGANFRGVKVYLAEQRGALGVLIYSDPQDDGYYRGDPYPNGPWRPATGVQRGSVQYLFKYPGDPETPGFASTPSLPDSRRMNPDGNQPHIISIPLSYHDAAPILQALKGADVPQGWQGALPFRYHIGGAGAVRVHLVSQQDYQRRLIWDVIGKIKGSEFPDQWVIAGNHRDAWTFGAVDPNSGTAAMLEAIHGLGALLKQGWRPKRTVVFCSWDAEEEGLIGSTEWVEQNGALMDHAVAYFNTDVGVSGPNFGAAAVPSLKQFIRNVTKVVPSPLGGNVYEQWRLHQTENENRRSNAPPESGNDVRVSDLGSGSDFTPFLQHAGVPSTDIGSHGPYGVYHSAFDDYAWFVMNADPQFLYEQEMARIFGLEALRMADDPVLPYDYEAYAAAIGRYLIAAKRKAADEGFASLDFSPAQAADAHFAAAARKVQTLRQNPPTDVAALNQHLREVELDLLSSAGLPNRPWFKHTIYAPGEYTGYSAVVIPGVNEAIDARKPEVAQQQLSVLTQALDRAAQTLDSAQ